MTRRRDMLIGLAAFAATVLVILGQRLIAAVSFV